MFAGCFRKPAGRRSDKKKQTRVFLCFVTTSSVQFSKSDTQCLHCSFFPAMCNCVFELQVCLRMAHREPSLPTGPIPLWVAVCLLDLCFTTLALFGSNVLPFGGCLHCFSWCCGCLALDRIHCLTWEMHPHHFSFQVATCKTRKTLELNSELLKTLPSNYHIITTTVFVCFLL